MHVWQEERPAGILSWVSVSTENCVFVRSQHLSFPVSMSWLFSWLQHQSIEALKATRPSRKWQTAEETCSDCFKYTLFTVCCSQPCHVAATYPPPPTVWNTQKCTQRRQSCDARSARRDPTHLFSNLQHDWDDCSHGNEDPSVPHFSAASPIGPSEPKDAGQSAWRPLRVTPGACSIPTKCMKSHDPVYSQVSSFICSVF